MEQEEMLSTKVTEDDIENGVADEYGVVYSKDGQRLLLCNDELELKTYIVKDGTKVICFEAFCGCLNLQQIIIPNSVINIGQEAFVVCDSLEQITISNSSTVIGKWPFYGCDSLKKIIIPEGSEDHFKQMLSDEFWDKLVTIK